MSSSLPSLIDLFINRVKRLAKTICEVLNQASPAISPLSAHSDLNGSGSTPRSAGPLLPQLEQASG